MGEVQEGRTADVISAALWLARTVDLPVSHFAAYRWIDDVAALGHAEVDRENGRWFAAPRVITVLPGGAGYAVLAGLRTNTDDELLDAVEVPVHRVQQEGPAAGLTAPTSVLLQYDSEEDLDEAARLLSATRVPCTALQLASHLPPLTPGPLAAPPARGNTTLERFDGDSLSWAPVAHATMTGAYRFSAMGRKYRWHDAGSWYRTDPSGAAFLALRRQGKNVISWRGDAAGFGDLLLPGNVPMPSLAYRASVLCSGLLPTKSTDGELRFDNVPRRVAEQVAASLGQQLPPA